MPPCMVTAPPESPVPAPRGTTGMWCLAATLITPATSSVVEARTTASGRAPSIEASRSKMRRSLAESITDSRPTIRRSSSTTECGRAIRPAAPRVRGCARTLRTYASSTPGMPGASTAVSADDEQVEPPAAFLVGRHAVHALEDRLLDAAVRRDLDRVPDRQAIRGDDMVGLVDATVHRQSHRLRLGRGAQSRRDGCDVIHRVQLKLDEMTGRERVQAAIAMGVADRPPVGAWGHTYREEWSPRSAGGHHHRAGASVWLGLREVPAAREQLCRGVRIGLQAGGPSA